MPLREYIYSHYPSIAEFARKHNIWDSQVQDWIDKDYIVVNGQLYSVRRKLMELK
jgi:hypothetical protein